MSKKKWIAYGVTGVVGLGLIAGTAGATAAVMDLRTSDGVVVPGGGISGEGAGLTSIEIRESDAPVQPTESGAPAIDSAPTPEAPLPPAPVSPPTPQSVVSAASVASVDSPPSN